MPQFSVFMRPDLVSQVSVQSVYFQDVIWICSCYLVFPLYTESGVCRAHMYVSVYKHIFCFRGGA